MATFTVSYVCVCVCVCVFVCLSICTVANVVYEFYLLQNPLKPFRPKNEVERAQYKEMRRASHINAEQKRRGNIKVR